MLTSCDGRAGAAKVHCVWFARAGKLQCCALKYQNVLSRLVTQERGRCLRQLGLAQAFLQEWSAAWRKQANMIRPPATKAWPIWRRMQHVRGVRAKAEAALEWSALFNTQEDPVVVTLSWRRCPHPGSLGAIVGKCLAHARPVHKVTRCFPWFG